jgi:hypothetical protein
MFVVPWCVCSFLLNKISYCAHVINMDVNGKVHMVHCVQMVTNFKFHSYGLQFITIVRLHSHNTKPIIVNEPLCLIIVLDLTLWFYGIH